jgi:predicted SAM-dependent methyltransferase
MMLAIPKRLLRKTAQAAVRSFGFDLRRIPLGEYQSETSKCRARLAPYCVGYGVDLGPGGDPITESAIRIDLPQPYSRAGVHPVQLGGDATNLYWFHDGVLDYVYASHLLEDFEGTKSILVEWLRVLRPGGNLIIFCPDEQVYRDHCKRTGQAYNEHHKLANFSLATVKATLTEIGGTAVIHEVPLIDAYSWELVAQKCKDLRTPGV